VDGFRDENSGQQNGVIPGVFDNSRGVEYSVQNVTKVSARPEQPGV
jgi:hypothetical protein